MTQAEKHKEANANMRAVSARGKIVVTLTLPVSEKGLRDASVNALLRLSAGVPALPEGEPKAKG